MANLGHLHHDPLESRSGWCLNSCHLKSVSVFVLGKWWWRRVSLTNYDRRRDEAKQNVCLSKAPNGLTLIRTFQNSRYTDFRKSKRSPKVQGGEVMLAKSRLKCHKNVEVKWFLKWFCRRFFVWITEKNKKLESEVNDLVIQWSPKLWKVSLLVTMRITNIVTSQFPNLEVNPWSEHCRYIVICLFAIYEEFCITES